MIFFRRVEGASMVPSLRPRQIIVGISPAKIQKNEVVVVDRKGREIIKRITKISGDKVWVEGDNPAHSTDSRDFGWVNKSDILGSMKHTFPVAIEPPKVRNARAPLLGWIAAAILILFALVHLFRIDTFVPELALVFDGDNTTTFWIASMLVSMEVFALPFLMRMRLSPLAQYVSGAFAVIVPLTWLLIAIWTAGTGVSTAQLGEFVSLPGSVLLIVVNSLWLAFSYYTIWALGYDNTGSVKPKTKK